MSNSDQLVQKLWNYCNILRDDGLSFRLRLWLRRDKSSSSLVATGRVRFALSHE